MCPCAMPISEQSGILYVHTIRSWVDGIAVSLPMACHESRDGVTAGRMPGPFGITDFRRNPGVCLRADLCGTILKSFLVSVQYIYLC
jgi:hypothetical protein